MRIFHILLLPLCLLFAHMGPGAGILAYLGRKVEEYKCGIREGFCYYPDCPPPTKTNGHCYKGKANCCV